MHSPVCHHHVVRSDDEQAENDQVSFDGDEEKDEGYGQRGGGGEEGVRREDSEEGVRREDSEEGVRREDSEEGVRREDGEEGVREEDSEADLRKEDGGVQGQKSPSVKYGLSLPVKPLPQPACSPVLRQNIPLLHDLSPNWSRRRIAFHTAPTSGLYSSVHLVYKVIAPPTAGGGLSEDLERPNDPSFVFLQLFHNAALSLLPAPEHTPLLLAADEVRSLQFTVECECVVVHLHAGHNTSSEAAGSHSSIQYTQDWCSVCWQGAGS